MLLAIEKLRDGAIRDADQIASFVLGVSRTMAKDLKRLEWRREKLRGTFLPASLVAAPADDAILDIDQLERCLAQARRSRAPGRPADVLRGEDRKRGRQGASAHRRQRAGDPAPRHRPSADVHDVPRRGPMMLPCQAPVPDATLLDYWAGDLVDGEEMTGSRSICSRAVTARHASSRWRRSDRGWPRSCVRGGCRGSCRAPFSIDSSVTAPMCACSGSRPARRCHAPCFPATTSSSPRCGQTFRAWMP